MAKDDISSLPKWAQERFSTIQRERDISVRELSQWNDSQTKSNFFITEYVTNGEKDGFKKRYIQTNKISIQYEGIYFEAMATDGEISISWSGGEEAHSGGEVAFIPVSYQRAKLTPHGKMRVR